MILANLGKPKPEYIKSLDNILFGFGLSKLGGNCGSPKAFAWWHFFFKFTGSL